MSSKGALNVVTLDNLPGSTGASLVGFLPAGTGALTENLQTLGRRVVWADQYGSGMTTTPAADINAAQAALGSTGGIVRMPPGTFQIETAILHSSKVTLQGAGIDATILQQKTGYNGNVINQATSTSSKSVTFTQTTGTGTATSTAHGYAVGDVVFHTGAVQLEYNGAFEILTVPSVDTYTFKVSKDATTPATGTITVYKETDNNLKAIGFTILGASGASGGKGIQYDGVHRFKIEDVETRGTTEHGISIVSGYKGSILNCAAHSVITATHIGILLGQSSPSISYACGIDIFGCKTSQNGQDGILVEQGRDVRISGCFAWRNGQSGIKVGKAQRVTVNGNTSWGNTTGIHGQGPWLNLSITGNSCCLNGDSGILISQTSTSISSKTLSITGNVCDDNGQVSTSSSYGIAFEQIASSTVDSVSIVGNVCTNQTRGISFGTSGTVSNVVLASNVCKNNTVDFVAGAALQTTTLIKGFNIGTTGGVSSALSYATQIHRLHFWVDNVAQNATTALSDGFSGRGYVMPEAGFVRRVYVKGNAVCTAGTATFEVLKNGVDDSTLHTIIDSVTNTTTLTTTTLMFSDTFAAGDLITAQVVASLTFAPTGSTDYDMVVEVCY